MKISGGFGLGLLAGSPGELSVDEGRSGMDRRRCCHCCVSNLLFRR
jgi:hypothetical protein